MKNLKPTMQEQEMNQIINIFRFYVKTLHKKSIYREILEDTLRVILVLRSERTK